MVCTVTTSKAIRAEQVALAPKPPGQRRLIDSSLWDQASLGFSLDPRDASSLRLLSPAVAVWVCGVYICLRVDFWVFIFVLLHETALCIAQTLFLNLFLYYIWVKYKILSCFFKILCQCISVLIFNIKIIKQSCSWGLSKWNLNSWLCVQPFCSKCVMLSYQMDPNPLWSFFLFFYYFIINVIGFQLLSFHNRNYYLLSYTAFHLSTNVNHTVAKM